MAYHKKGLGLYKMRNGQQAVIFFCVDMTECDDGMQLMGVMETITGRYVPDQWTITGHYHRERDRDSPFDLVELVSTIIVRYK